MDDLGHAIAEGVLEPYVEFFVNAPSDIDYLLNDVAFYRALHAGAEAQANELLKENQRLREALEFYADPNVWVGQSRQRLSIAVTEDCGKIARQALLDDIAHD